MTVGPHGTELADAPRDGISSVEFSRIDPSLLAVASWDKTVSLYDVVANVTRARYSHQAAVLDLAFSSAEDVVYSAGLDRVVKQYNVASQSERDLGSHEDAVRCVEYSSELRQVITGSWDKSVKLWDDRQSTALTGTLDQPDKVYSLSTVQNKVVVATAGRRVLIYDLRAMKQIFEEHETTLKFMIRKVACTPTGEGFASSSIEGRIAVEYFDRAAEVQAKNYSFKCHRQTIDGVDTIYPVNALAYHPIRGTFASGGGDGIVNIWDGLNKKRLKQYARYPTSIASLSFNKDGTLLAVASSYTFEEGEKDHPVDAVYVRSISDAEVRPKTVAAGAQ
ncbi:WD40-repeat-containing domain protein [Entophlyctis helioformis]|nr:WD40-repeat-containing domain protein [Entophlyctis helioformis]